MDVNRSPNSRGARALADALVKARSVIRARRSLMRDWLSIALMTTLLAPSIVGAQNVVQLNMGDTYFEWRRLSKTSQMCGFAIFGNHTSFKDPKIEWDLHVAEMVNGPERAAGVSAGTFNVSGKTRDPRPPITDISFSLEDYPTPIAARLIGAPDQYNGVRGAFELEAAIKLLFALANGHPIEATLKYADGSSDVLKFFGYRDVNGGKNSDLEECLRGRAPSRPFQQKHPLPY